MKGVRKLASITLAMTTASVALSALAVGQETPGSTSQVERGRYLVTIAGCNDCHTPFKMGANGPEPDMERMLSGHPESAELPAPPVLPEGAWAVMVSATNTAWSGPWGVSFTANLTPDPETGLGQWTLRNFMDTIRSGRHLGSGRPILPPMPILFYKEFTDEDLGAIFAFLQTVPPIRNQVPEPWAAPVAQGRSR